MTSFLTGHGTDDCLDPSQLPLSHVGCAEISGLDPRDHREELVQRTHFLQPLQLIEEIFQRESLLPKFALSLEDYDKILAVQRNHELIIEVEILTDRPCTLTDRNDPIVEAACWATQKLTQNQPVYAGVPGATDGTYLWALKNIPIVTMGAGDREVPHQKDEWVDLDQLIETAKIYTLAALQYLWPPGTD